MSDDSGKTPVVVDDVTEVRPSWIWIKDAKGFGSVTVTLLAVSFWVTTFAYIMSIVEKIGPVSVRPFDIGACSSYFAPILVLYFSRKYTQAKFSTDTVKVDEK